jgi:proteasome lid subunit RPN8/RPN11
MTHTLTLKQGTWTRLRTHLLQNDVEQVAIVFSSTSHENGGISFNELDHILLTEKDFDFQSAYHISLTDEAQAMIIKAAWDKRSSIVEFHSHVDPGHDPRFSPSDLNGFQEFVPHVWWRLRGRPYAAIVVAERGIDSLVWTENPDIPEPLGQMLVDGSVLSPTGNSIGSLRRNNGSAL